MSDVSPGSPAAVFLRKSPENEAQAGQHLCRDRRRALLILGQKQLEQLRDGALFDDEVAVDEGLAEPQLGIKQDAPLRPGSSEPHCNRQPVAASEAPGNALGRR